MEKIHIEKEKQNIKRKEKTISKKTLKKLICITIIMLYTFLNIYCFASSSERMLVKRSERALNKIYKMIVDISTPAAIVALCLGLLMRKFSFGEEERIRMSKKIIRGSLFAYTLILLSSLIIKTIQAILGTKGIGSN